MNTGIRIWTTSKAESGKVLYKRPRIAMLSEAQMEHKLRKRELTLRTIAIITTVIGAAWGLWQYLEKRQQEIDTRKQEYQLNTFKEQKETLFPLCKAAAEIIASKDLADAQFAIKNFEVLYYGQVGIIADDSTAKVAQSFAAAVAQYKLGSKTDEPPLRLIQILGELTSICKKTLVQHNTHRSSIVMASKSPN